MKKSPKRKTETRREKKIKRLTQEIKHLNVRNSTKEGGKKTKRKKKTPRKYEVIKKRIKKKKLELKNIDIQMGEKKKKAHQVTSTINK